MSVEDLSEEIQQLVMERQQARDQGDFDRADDIREKLAQQGIQVEDTPQGQRLLKHPT